jgi:eukaryotic-like serine/threonine-protein kinase
MPALPQIGALIGDRYKVERHIGTGGMQYVFLAKDMLFTRQVALKVPKEDAALRRFQNSAVVSARVNHPNIAKTLDYLDDGNGSYLIEEYVLGADLSQIFPSQIPVIPPTASARILHLLAKGLAASHHAGVVHRDLKPSNIMIEGGIQLAGLKITDFGIAKMAEAEIGLWADAEDRGSTTSKTVLGAIPYMSPESIIDFKKATFPSDMWAIAAISYELLSGKKPFGGNLASIPQILSATPPPPPAAIAAPQFRALGGELFDIILCCLQKNPEDRPTADQLVQKMEGLCYATYNYEFGTVKQVRHPKWGFISADSGNDLIYHKDNFYGLSKPISVGDRLWFARHAGEGNDRAVPIVRLP